MCDQCKDDVHNKKTFQCLCRWITMMRVLLLPLTDQIQGHKE